MMKRRGEREKRRKGEFLLHTIFVFLFGVFSISAQEISVKNKLQKGDFPLMYKNQTVEIYVSNEDFKVARIAAEDFVSDVEKVSGAKLQIKNTDENSAKNIHTENFQDA